MTGRDACGGARRKQAFVLRTWPAVAAAVIALVAMLGLSLDARTRVPPLANSLVAAEPEPNALLATAPDRIALTFAEPMDLESASVRLLRAGGAEAALEPVQVEDADSTRISAMPDSVLGAGDYTVLWAVQAADDGELFTGAYPFRAGVVTNPGAAQLAGEWHDSWAAIAR